LPLFIEVPRRGVLGSSYTKSRIDPAPVVGGWLLASA
jgi:hypothetical protein